MEHRIDQAFSKTPRVLFLPTEMQMEADYDMPLPIGYGQTNSQPYTVRKMLEWLDPKEGDTVLDVGSGSGWTTALLAHLVGKDGKVIAVERVPELVEFGRNNCEKLNIKNVTFREAGKVFGWPKQAPFKRILVSAGADNLPQDLLDQLAPGGKLVIPVKGSILEISKDKASNTSTKEHPGFTFVPLLMD